MAISGMIGYNEKCPQTHPLGRNQTGTLPTRATSKLHFYGHFYSSRYYFFRISYVCNLYYYITYVDCASRSPRMNGILTNLTEYLR
jgi:hypothetical protein